MDWFGDIKKKFETLQLDVDNMISLETFKYVEDKLEVVGANVKHFCSEFMQDVLPPISVDSVTDIAPHLLEEQDNNDNLAAEEGLNEVVHKDSVKELGNVDSLPDASVAEPVEKVLGGLSLKQHTDVGMCDNTDMGVKGSPTEETPFPSEISKEVPPELKDASTKSSSGNVLDREGDNDRVNESASISVEDSLEPMKAFAGVSDALPLSNSTISDESCGSNDLDTALNSPCGGLSTVSTDTTAAYGSENVTECSLVRSELCDESEESEEFGSIPDFESSDDSDDAVETGDDHVTKPGEGITRQHNEWKLGRSCIFVDDNEFFSPKSPSSKERIELALSSRSKVTKKKKYDEPAATQFEDFNLNGGGTISTTITTSTTTTTTTTTTTQNAKTCAASTTLSGKVEPVDDDDPSESDWEVI